MLYLKLLYLIIFPIYTSGYLFKDDDILKGIEFGDSYDFQIPQKTHYASGYFIYSLYDNYPNSCEGNIVHTNVIRFNSDNCFQGAEHNSSFKLLLDIGDINKMKDI